MNDICEEDYTYKFITDENIFIGEDLIKWVRGDTFDLGFVVIILRSNYYNGQSRRKMYVLLGSERGGKYIQI